MRSSQGSADREVLPATDAETSRLCDNVGMSMIPVIDSLERRPPHALAAIMNTSAMLFVLLAFLTGCNNQPGAIEMTVHGPARPCGPHEQVKLTAIIRSKSGAQCVWKGHSFTVQLQSTDGRQF